MILYYNHGSHAILIFRKSAYFETWASQLRRVLTIEYFWQKSGKSPDFQSMCQNLKDQHRPMLVEVFLKCCGNDIELFGNPSNPLTNHQCHVVWQHLVPAKISCFILKILLRSNWEPISTHMMSRGSCIQFDRSRVSERGPVISGPRNLTKNLCLDKFKT